MPATGSSAIPGAETLQSTTPAAAGAQVVLAVLLVGMAFWLLQRHVRRRQWLGADQRCCWLVLLAVARRSADRPTFGEAGQRGPVPSASGRPRSSATCSAGSSGRCGSTRYSKFWMPLLGAALALMVRSIVLQIYRARPAKSTRCTPPSSHVPPTNRRRRRRGGASDMALLETRGLTVTLRRPERQRRASTSTSRPGKLVGLIGPNGAGKTTFIDAITGFTHVTSGTVDVRRRRPHRPDARRAGPTSGLARTFQSLELFEDLTVRDNLLVAAERPRWYSFLVDIVRPGVRRAGLDAAGRPGARRARPRATLADTLPSDLSPRPAQAGRRRPGARRRPEAAAARRAGRRPRHRREPAARRPPAAVPRRAASTVFLIDHDMGLVLNVCDYIYVLDFGKVIAHGTPAEVRADPAVIAAYLGEIGRRGAGPGGHRGRPRRHAATEHRDHATSTEARR